MKGDFSFVGHDPASGYSGVLHQQGRVLLDRDWNDAQAIASHWRATAAADTFGPGVLAVPSSSAAAWQVLSATADAAGIHLELAAGRAWASGLLVERASHAVLDAVYLEPPLAPAVDPATIAAGVRDAVVLEVFEDSISGWQDPARLIEPALGGPDTTERMLPVTRLKLLRLGPNQDCSAVAGLVDDPAMRGRLSVTPSPSLVIDGDCPLEAGGGYTGFEHFLYRIEIAPPAAGRARFQWSRFNGGLVGRGVFAAGAAGTGVVTVTANAAAIDAAGLPSFHLEALAYDAAVGAWAVVFTATAARSGDGVLALSAIAGVWPAAAGATAFFRLWDGIADVVDFAAAAPTPLVDGIELQFDAPQPGNVDYRPGDFWTFPVRASGAAFDPPVWPLAAPPAGIVRRRVALAEIHWQADGTASWELGQIDDCRRIFRPLAQQKICCSYVVGDGRSSFGDFDSIELALRHLPAAGGEICLLPGLHHCNAVINGRVNVTIRGCGARTRVLPREKALDDPIVTVIDSRRVVIDQIDFVTIGGIALHVEGTRPGACDDVVITHHRILACRHAVLAREVGHLVVANNHIRMFDLATGRAAIDVAADDSLIERNDIALIPAETTPPIDPDNPDDPDDDIDPVDPCVRLGKIYHRPLVLLRYVDRIWMLALPLTLIWALKQPYRAHGGIVVRGGSERLRVLDNRVVGGSGNGITLGSPAPDAPPPPPPPPPPTFEIADGRDARVAGRVIDADGQPLPGVQITLTRSSDGSARTFTASTPDGTFVAGLGSGTYEISEGAVGLEIAKVDVQTMLDGNILLVTIVLVPVEAPRRPADGFLYEIAVERNRVAAMGLSGIGVPLLPAPGRDAGAIERALALLGSPVLGLVIADNQLIGNLRNPFDAALRAATLQRGIGGISLGLVDDARITGNRIEGHGRSGIDPVCGVFVAYGETVEVSRNTVVDNGVLPTTAAAELQPGRRGGIVLGLVANFGLFALLRQRGQPALARGVVSRPSASAARIAGNLVEQPVGHALRVNAFGPLMVTDNVLASDRSGVGGLDALVGGVLLVNLAGVQNAGLAVQLKSQHDPAGGPVDGNEAGQPNQPVGGLSGARAGARLQTVQTRAYLARAAPLLPAGTTMFNDNQVRAGAAHTAPLTQLLLAFDDIGYADNQCTTDQTANVFANTMLLAASLRAMGNRFRERDAETNLSLLTISTRINNTSFNQGDHCIVSQDTDPAPPATVQPGNQVVNAGRLCNSFNMVTALMFKPVNVTTIEG